jgi:membrane fusion protein, copper/silver efflux system
MTTKQKQLLTGAGLLLAGLLIGWLLFGGSDHEDPHAGHDHGATAEAGQVWTCSMHPSVRSDEPGSCPICGMALIPASSESREDDYTMVMTEASMRLADIQTTPVIVDNPSREMQLPGRITVDERRTSFVTTHFGGRIRDVMIDFTGAPIRRGEVMATIYSPELVSAQRELLEAARVRQANPALYRSALRKFELWEFSEEQVQAIIDRGEVQVNLEILSPANGYVTARNVQPEQYVEQGTVIYEVAGLDRLWVTLDAYEEDLAWLNVGNSVQFRTRSNPGRTYEATVNFIDPVLDPETRTVRVRADVRNPDGSLRPEMLVNATVSAAMPGRALMVPATAVLWTGPRSLVYVKDPTADVPRFQVREVELGMRSGDFYVIENGLEEGERVVFNGAFRIDSEMQLADRFSMMNRTPGAGAVPVHDHGQMQDRPVREGSDRQTQIIDHSDHIPGDFRSEVTALVQTYLELKDALFASDFGEAQQKTTETQQKLEAIGEHRLDGSAHTAWMQTWNNLQGHLRPMAASGDIETLRAEFRYLSDLMVVTVKSFGIEGVVYQQYCPMAFDDEGAYWLSSEEQIRNPYLPETMPGCGEVIERIVIK